MFALVLIGAGALLGLACFLAIGLLHAVLDVGSGLGEVPHPFGGARPGAVPGGRHERNP